jgi:hypothetical protein
MVVIFLSFELVLDQKRRYAMRSSRSSDDRSMMRGVDPYSIPSASLRAAYARERAAPYPSPYMRAYVSSSCLSRETEEEKSTFKPLRLVKPQITDANLHFSFCVHQLPKERDS